MTVAEERLLASLTEYQDRVLATWGGHEKELVFELARTLDVAALALTIPLDAEPAGATSNADPYLLIASLAALIAA